MKNKKDKVKQRAGRLGGKATNRVRHETLVELSKLVDKDDLSWMQAKWRTEQLVKMLKYLRKNERK